MERYFLGNTVRKAASIGSRRIPQSLLGGPVFGRAAASVKAPAPSGFHCKSSPPTASVGFLPVGRLVRFNPSRSPAPVQAAFIFPKHFTFSPHLLL